MISNVIKKVKRYVTDPIFRFNVNSMIGLYNKLSDEKYLKKQFMLNTGQKLDLTNPIGFNAKMQWLKLYNRQDIYTTMVDKYSVKSYLTPIIGKEHIAGLLGAWTDPDDIEFAKLPDKFVLKTTHGCGGMFICRDKKKLDFLSVKKQLKKALKRNYYNSCREWPYKNVKPRIIAEEYLQDGDSKILNVYKVFCFSGVPYLIQTIQNDKTRDETIDYFDTKWNLLKLKQNFPNSKVPLKRPKTLDEILELSKACSRDIPFVRTDWYEVNGNVIFSEFTFFSDAGLAKFYPSKWDIVLGNMINLPDR